MKWISIKEQEPKIHQTVLLTDGKEVVVGYLTTQDSWNYCECYHLGFKTHWMPLPDFPKENDQKDDPEER
jgi:hypothetical protein